jgi:hypothetical protein
MTYKIWNKEDKINGVDADRIIDNLGIKPDDEVFLILDNADSVHFIEISRIIKSVYDLDENLSVDEVAEEYIRIKEKEKLQNENEKKKAEDLSKRLAALEEENAMLKEEMSITQDALNELIFNMMDGE